MFEQYAAHSVDLSVAAGGGLPERVHLLPIGTVTGKDGRGPYVVRDQAHARQVVAATQAWHKGAPVPVDYDHQTLNTAANGKPNPAAAWITGFQVDDKGVWGTVEWTAAAAAQIKDRAFRFISPVFAHDPAGAVTRIWHAAVTNLPNLELTAFAAQALQPHGVPMDELLKKLREAYGLAADATAETVVAHAQAQATAAKAVTATLATTAKALGLDDKATADQIAAAAQTAAAQATAGTPDLGQYVPMAQYTALSATVAALQARMVKDEASAEVDKAVAAGKIAPATKEHMLAWASQDLAAFKTFVEASPVIVTPGGTGVAGGPPAAASGGLSDVEIAACSQMGVLIEDFKKTREGK